MINFSQIIWWNLFLIWKKQDWWKENDLTFIPCVPFHNKSQTESEVFWNILRPSHFNESVSEGTHKKQQRFPLTRVKSKPSDWSDSARQDKLKGLQNQTNSDQMGGLWRSKSQERFQSEQSLWDQWMNQSASDNLKQMLQIVVEKRNVAHVPALASHLSD